MSQFFLRFPGGLAKALTLSYDDGVDLDRRLIGLMQRHGLKGTFNINSGLYAPEDKVYPAGAYHRRMTRQACLDVYADSGMEVAVHTLTHPFLEKLPPVLCAQEVLQDRRNLESDFGGLVQGMAYPFGSYSDSVLDTLRSCGIVYSRTTVSTGRFDLPADWLLLHPTCHHNDPQLMALADKFLSGDAFGRPAMFYLWGHSYEFERDDNWHVIEAFAEKMGGRSDVWYATNIQICRYVCAWNALRWSCDGSLVENPSAQDVWLSNNERTVCVPAGDSIRL